MLFNVNLEGALEYANKLKEKISRATSGLGRRNTDFFHLQAPRWPRPSRSLKASAEFVT
jgi:hypothetical protein